jgi:hypothetical protein
MIIALYQIPFVVITFSDAKMKRKILQIGENIFGLKILSGSNELLIEVFILAFYYIQAKVNSLIPFNIRFLTPTFTSSI